MLQSKVTVPVEIKWRGTEQEDDTLFITVRVIQRGVNIGVLTSFEVL